jgi:hypothetical protein
MESISLSKFRSQYQILGNVLQPSLSFGAVAMINTLGNRQLCNKIGNNFMKESQPMLPKLR